MANKLTQEQINQLVNDSIELQRKCKGLRTGQALFNALSELNQDLSEEITGTEADCFYDDSKVGEFFKYITEQ